MIMLGAMYAPSDKVTLMGMAMFNDKEMTLDTHQGMMQRKYLGTFETSSSDLSKVSILLNGDMKLLEKNLYPNSDKNIDEVLNEKIAKIGENLIILLFLSSNL